MNFVVSYNILCNQCFFVNDKIHEVNNKLLILINEAVNIISSKQIENINRIQIIISTLKELQFLSSIQQFNSHQNLTIQDTNKNLNQMLNPNSKLRQSLQLEQKCLNQKYSKSNSHRKTLHQALQKINKSAFLHKIKNLKTEQAYNYDQQQQKPIHKQIKLGKSSTKYHPTTSRPDLMKSTHQPNEIILVYLMYKQQKLSLFLNKGQSFEIVVKKMYNQIYTYEKQKFSVSNAILKNLLYKITGFQTIDNDILFDYQFKYNRGTLTQKKLFVPFRQENLKMPFKIYTKISSNSYGGHQFLVRNFTDGEWAILTTIKKSTIEEQKLNQIKKSLKTNFSSASFLIKSSPSTFSQINWMETKIYIMIVSQFFPETFQQNLTKNIAKQNLQEKQNIFLYYTKWLTHVFKQLVLCNIQNFQNISLKSIGLDAKDGLPRISIFSNVINCLGFSQKRKNLNQNEKRVSYRIQDSFYFETYQSLITSLKSLLQIPNEISPLIQDFTNFVEYKKSQSKFSFELVLQYLSFNDSSLNLGSYQGLKEKNPLQIDFTSWIKKINESIETKKDSLNSQNQQSFLIQQVKQQIRSSFSIHNMRRNKHRNEHKSILQMLSTTTEFADFKKDNISNFSEFIKQEQRKSEIKTIEKQYIHEIIHELNQNEDFIKTTKENNLASIGFYLKKSDRKIKQKIIGKIENKYNKFFEKMKTGSDEDTLIQKTKDELMNHLIKTKRQQLNLNKNNLEIQSMQQRENLLSNKKTHTKNIFSLPLFHGNSSKMISNKENVGITAGFFEKNNLKAQKSLEQVSENFNTKIFGKLFQNTEVLSLLPSSNTRRSKLEEIFVNRKDNLKEKRMMLKKKKYGIYLQEAEKQYNKIKVYKNDVNQNFAK